MRVFLVVFYQSISGGVFMAPLQLICITIKCSLKRSIVSCRGIFSHCILPPGKVNVMHNIVYEAWM